MFLRRIQFEITMGASICSRLPNAQNQELQNELS